MTRKEWLRIGLQAVVCAIVLALYLFRYPETDLLFSQLLLTCVAAILISTLIESKVRLNGPINSITANLLVAFLFYAVGSFLSESLTLEIVESIEPEFDQGNSPDEMTAVVTSAIINFGGWEFLFFYLFNAVFAYAKYLPEFGKGEEQAETLEISESLAAAPNKFSVKQGGKLHFIPYDEINYVEASGNYINIFSGGKKYTLRESLRDWLAETKKDNLLRVHRSFVINTNAIKELSSNSDGQYSVVLDSGDAVKVGKQYKAELFDFLGLK